MCISWAHWLGVGLFNVLQQWKQSFQHDYLRVLLRLEMKKAKTKLEHVHGTILYIYILDKKKTLERSGKHTLTPYKYWQSFHKSHSAAQRRPGHRESCSPNGAESAFAAMSSYRSIFLALQESPSPDGWASVIWPKNALYCPHVLWNLVLPDVQLVSILWTHHEGISVLEKMTKCYEMIKDDKRMLKNRWSKC